MAKKKITAKKLVATQAGSDLVISSNDKKPLSKTQLAFNKLTQRIAKLHKDIENKYALFDKAIQLYATSISPLRNEKREQTRKVLDLMWPIYKEKKLPKNDQRLLKEMMQNLMDDLFGLGEKNPDEALKKMFKELNGESFEAVQKKEKEMMKDEMEGIFSDLDIDIDMDNVEMGSDEMAEKIREAQKKMEENEARDREKYAHRKKHQKKTAKQEEKEMQQQQVDEMKQKNLSTIYKQLAKLFHPDLEQDESRRAEKEILMKELTTAYQAKNLHALLTLELKWIHKETDHLENLTEEKLNIYIEVLREQAQELESEKYRIFQLPQYSVLAQEYGFAVANKPYQVVQHEERELAEEIDAIKYDIIQLGTQNAFKHIKKLIRMYEEDEAEEGFDMDDIFDSLFGKY